MVAVKVIACRGISRSRSIWSDIGHGEFCKLHMHTYVLVFVLTELFQHLLAQSPQSETVRKDQRSIVTHGDRVRSNKGEKQTFPRPCFKPLEDPTIVLEVFLDLLRFN